MTMTAKWLGWLYMIYAMILIAMILIEGNLVAAVAAPIAAGSSALAVHWWHTYRYQQLIRFFDDPEWTWEQ